MRAIYLAGRIGTSLLVVGLALYLVYLIPSISLNTSSVLGGSLAPMQYNAAGLQPLSPTRGAHIVAQGNDSYQIVLLAVDSFSFFNWTRVWACDGGQPIGLPGCNGWENYTALRAYMIQNPKQVLVNASGMGGQQLTKDYTPTTETNATFVLANPTARWMDMSYTISYTGNVAPKGVTLLISEILIPVGIIFALPWMYGTLAARRTRNPSKM